MSFANAIAVCFQKYATVSGRATRPEYWWFFLFATLLSIVASIAESAAGLNWGDSGYGLLTTAVSLVLLLPSIAVGARRLHDTGRSGWWQLLFVIPCVGFIILIILLSERSQPHPNDYDQIPTY